jgi:hypothetical protein
MERFLTLDSLPYVSLIKGNLSDEDKSNLVRSIVDRYNISDSDVLVVNSLTTESSQVIKDFISYEPMASLKLVVVSMDKAAIRAQNSLLTVLESPPPRVRFILFSSSLILPTIQSRSEIFHTPVKREVSKQSKSNVLSVLKAASALNESLLEDSFKNWDEECQFLLLQWTIESKLMKPGYFSPEELSELKFPKGFEDNLLIALNAVDSARARISAKSILLSYVERNKGTR